VSIYTRGNTYYVDVREHEAGGSAGASVAPRQRL
jgi:hypothetical protein